MLHLKTQKDDWSDNDVSDMINKRTMMTMMMKNENKNILPIASTLNMKSRRKPKDTKYPKLAP